jgi:hypothetical protein
MKDFMEVVSWRGPQGACHQYYDFTYLNLCLCLLLRSDLWWYLQLSYVKFTCAGEVLTESD